MPVPLTDPTAEPQTLDEVRDWHRGMVEALLERRAGVLRAIIGRPCRCSPIRGDDRIGS